MKFNVGDVVVYRFSPPINDHIEIGRVIEIVEPQNYIIELLIYTKHRFNLTQNICEWYLSPGNINDYTYLLNNPTYTSDIIVNDIINYVKPREIPKDSFDAITFEDIKDGEILLDFPRNSNKTEYDFDTYYKESHLDFILRNKKNLFTGLPIDTNTIVKYFCFIKN